MNIPRTGRPVAIALCASRPALQDPRGVSGGRAEATAGCRGSASQVSAGLRSGQNSVKAGSNRSLSSTTYDAGS
jgi:hypothetical protein